VEQWGTFNWVLGGCAGPGACLQQCIACRHQAESTSRVVCVYAVLPRYQACFRAMCLADLIFETCGYNDEGLHAPVPTVYGMQPAAHKLVHVTAFSASSHACASVLLSKSRVCKHSLLGRSYPSQTTWQHGPVPFVCLPQAASHCNLPLCSICTCRHVPCTCVRTYAQVVCTCMTCNHMGGSVRPATTTRRVASLLPQHVLQYTTVVHT
jgi:hypothetical protein